MTEEHNFTASPVVRHATLADGEALLARLDAGALPSTPVYRHGSLLVKLYRPSGEDRQQPHDRDEVYIVARGSGRFRNGGQVHEFGPGDMLFVPAGDMHRFEAFSEDFLVWVLFYGPDGGER